MKKLLLSLLLISCVSLQAMNTVELLEEGQENAGSVSATEMEKGKA